MIVWTIQTVDVYEKLLKEKVLYTNINLSSLYHMEDIGVADNPFQKGYDWLAKRMEEKIGRPEKATYPWWAWYKREMKHQRPDLREAGYGNRGEQLVCIELDIPDDEVVLSDFDLWWFCISDCWVSDATSDKEWDERDAWFDSLSKEEQERLKLQSWETIFDTNLDIRPWHERGKWVQATFWELRLSDVRDVKYFKAR